MGKPTKEFAAQVQALFAEVEKRKAAIAAAENPTCFVTNGNFRYSNDGAIHNLKSVRHIPQLVDMVVFLLTRKNAHEEACKLLETESSCNWLSVSVDHWISDIKIRVTQLSISDRKAALANLEEKLRKLAPKEVTDAMEMAEITKALNGL
jgi:hypothetical protein